MLINFNLITKRNEILMKIFSAIKLKHENRSDELYDVNGININCTIETYKKILCIPQIFNKGEKKFECKCTGFVFMLSCIKILHIE